ncbi:phospholipid phosphatase 3-like [Sarcophilus harrisii]|uniref:Phosphatidic acid phosphatase type 2/haloperoxidase domain-containing protein n=1 Tax=Sarcophilus harrisii TaxID=9305 RepID=A0A7N4Q026_SARHA|nr:phospholipid phosphatase 3-like [Sarcophilus harrisii]
MNKPEFEEPDCQVLAKQESEHQVWPDDRHTDQVTAQKNSSYPHGYNKKLFLVDLICILLVFIPFFLCEANIVDPIHVGFYCEDNSIKYPLKVPTIDKTILACTGLFISITSIILGELQWLRFQELTSPMLLSSTYMTMIYRELSAFFFGVTVNQSFTSIVKIFTGRLRPNFLDVCQPAYLQCKIGYITNYTCTGDPTEVSRARKSFFSGHAAFSMYCVIYLMLYLQARMIWKGSKWLRLMLQTILLPLPLVVGYFGVQNYWHHFSDVFAGFLQGLITALWVVFLISDIFSSEKCLSSGSSSCSENQDSSEQTSC